MKRNRVYIALIFLIQAQILIGQPVSEAGGGQAGVLKLYFFLLVFATIVSRLVEYIKLLLEWVWPQVKLLRDINTAIWKFARKRLDKLNLKYDETKMAGNINKLLKTVLLHILGFVLGIILCVSFGLGIFHIIGISFGNPLINQVLTGILIGAGIDPVHSVFRLTSEKKKIKELWAKISG